MGAMAITTVAGARLLGVAQSSPFLAMLRGYIEGFMVMMWAWGTWWIPLLAIVGVWKYAVRRDPLRYHPALWSIVFPLGTYATALHLLSHLPGLTFLAAIAPASSWIAFAAWVVVAVGWAVSAGAAVRLDKLSRTVHTLLMCYAKSSQPQSVRWRRRIGRLRPRPATLGSAR